MQLLPQGGSGTVQASSDAAKRTKIAEKTHCQACLPLLTDGTIRRKHAAAWAVHESEREAVTRGSVLSAVLRRAKSRLEG